MHKIMYRTSLMRYPFKSTWFFWGFFCFLYFNPGDDLSYRRSTISNFAKIIEIFSGNRANFLNCFVCNIASYNYILGNYCLCFILILIY